MGRFLGVDYGDKRVGLAVSDEMGIVATPLSVHTRTRAGDDVEAVMKICAEWKIERVVVGDPLNMNGSSGPASDKSAEFAERLRAASDIEVVLWDERMSTMSAERVLIEGNMSRKRRKGVVDKLAAQIILQNYLDSQ